VIPPVVHALQDTVFRALHEFDVLAKSFFREVIGALLLNPGAKHVKATGVNHNNHTQCLLPVHHRDGLIVDT